MLPGEGSCCEEGRRLQRQTAGPSIRSSGELRCRTKDSTASRRPAQPPPHSSASLRDRCDGTQRFCLKPRPSCEGCWRQVSAERRRASQTCCWGRQSCGEVPTERGRGEPEPVTAAESCQMPCHTDCHSSSDACCRIS